MNKIIIFKPCNDREFPNTIEDFCVTQKQKMQAIADFIEMTLGYLVEGINYSQDDDGKIYIEILADTKP